MQAMGAMHDQAIYGGQIVAAPLPMHTLSPYEAQQHNPYELAHVQASAYGGHGGHSELRQRRSHRAAADPSQQYYKMGHGGQMGVQHVQQVPQVHGGYPGPGQAQMVHQAQRLRSGPAPGMPSPGMMASVYVNHQGMQQVVVQQSMHPYGVDPDGCYVQLPPLPDST